MGNGKDGQEGIYGEQIMNSSEESGIYKMALEELVEEKKHQHLFLFPITLQSDSHSLRQVRLAYFFLFPNTFLYTHYNTIKMRSSAIIAAVATLAGLTSASALPKLDKHAAHIAYTYPNGTFTKPFDVATNGQAQKLCMSPLLLNG